MLLDLLSRPQPSPMMLRERIMRRARRRRRATAFANTLITIGYALVSGVVLVFASIGFLHALTGAIR